jgi:hypothetical protein
MSVLLRRLFSVAVSATIIFCPAVASADIDITPGSIGRDGSMRWNVPAWTCDMTC